MSINMSYIYNIFELSIKPVCTNIIYVSKCIKYMCNLLRYICSIHLYIASIFFCKLLFIHLYHYLCNICFNPLNEN